MKYAGDMSLKDGQELMKSQLEEIKQVLAEVEAERDAGDESIVPDRIEVTRLFIPLLELAVRTEDYISFQFGWAAMQIRLMQFEGMHELVRSGITEMVRVAVDLHEIRQRQIENN